MDEDPRLKALRMLRDGYLSAEDLWVWFLANGGDIYDEIGFEAELLDTRAWEPYELKILGWAIEDAHLIRH